ncbi:MAG TPA: nucleotidyl transferase [Clostridiaceae bacterium]|nr:nucleotidyl transferase [Clostridiaceae bacterium]
MQKYAVLMAGGSGTRLWPISKEASPKQFIPIEDDKSMLVHTIERLCKVVLPEQCFIITNRNLSDITKRTAGEYIPEGNILLEPERKNTAACIAYATILLQKRYKEGILCFVPADGYVKDTESYAEALQLAFDTAERLNCLVIIGVKPAYPATGYGYIHVEPVTSADVKVSPVLKFIEKPTLEKAQELVKSDDYLWNCGIVVGTMDAIIRNIKEYLPEHYHKLSNALRKEEDKAEDEYEAKNGSEVSTSVEKAYRELQSISFDNGVLEKCASSLYAVRASFGWDDIGSIDALAKILEADSEGNQVKGRHVGINTTNSVIYGKDVAICTIDVNNMIVVGTKDEVLVCPKDKSQEIRILVDKLKKQGHEDLL